MTSDLNHPCLGCAIVRGDTRTTGGVLARAPGWVLHAVASPSPVPGWVVLTSEQHVRGWYDLDEAPSRELGPLAARVMRAQREVLGAEHVYAFAIGDVLLHFHLHLVPRFADTPPHLRGRGVFDAAPTEHRSPEELEAAARRLATALVR
ncbi:HIT family protein [Corallococcus sp. bb12-1]|uniref:HIT family protein n=1 Tax=Corallococcus sp. bb12-1 TaxID=2996784 RepID=UPI00226ED534|nr:HIT family protein [Corallococcus sp. bb12-1]MCY1046588.1 HIT family protein [Corallococcus sp. bb12-1]